MGRLTRDPGVSYTAGDKPVCVARYTIAVDRYVKNPKEGEQTADFLPCVAFDKRGEFAEKYLHKGSKIAIEGHLRTGSYINKEGIKVYTTDVIVDNCEFAESKAEAQQHEAQAEAEQPKQKPAEGKAGDDGFLDLPDGIDEQMPFN